MCAQCFVVATLASQSPAAPFVLRNYEHSAAGRAVAARLGACPAGSSAFSLWQAVRASSAAPYYLDDFTLQGQRCAPAASLPPPATCLWGKRHPPSSIFF